MLVCSAAERVGRPATTQTTPEVQPTRLLFSYVREPAGKSVAKAHVFQRRVEEEEPSGGLSAGLGPSSVFSLKQGVGRELG